MHQKKSILSHFFLISGYFWSARSLFAHCAFCRFTCARTRAHTHDETHALPIAVMLTQATLRSRWRFVCYAISVSSRRRVEPSQSDSPTGASSSPSSSAVSASSSPSMRSSDFWLISSRRITCKRDERKSSPDESQNPFPRK